MKTGLQMPVLPLVLNNYTTDDMKYGLQKTTLIDFPGEVAATVFVPGCNLRCPYCHNPEFVTPPFPQDSMFSIEEIEAFLKKRKNVLGGVCITGGEPLLHTDISNLIEIIKQQGLKVKLDTNGTIPDRLKEITVDYIAMDIKTAPNKYKSLLAPAHDGEKVGKAVRQSAAYIISSGIPHEFRTTAAPGIFNSEDMKEIITLLTGSQRYVLTHFRPGKTLDPEWAEKDPYPPETLEKMRDMFREAGINCIIRE